MSFLRVKRDTTIQIGGGTLFSSHICGHELGKVSGKFPGYVPEQHEETQALFIMPALENSMNLCYIPHWSTRSTHLPTLPTVGSHEPGLPLIASADNISTSACRFCDTKTSISAAAPISLFEGTPLRSDLCTTFIQLWRLMSSSVDMLGRCSWHSHACLRMNWSMPPIRTPCKISASPTSLRMRRV